MARHLNKWRESASLILLSRFPFTRNEIFDYKILFMRRSQKSKFMPDAYVFPGGALANIDKSTKWLSLFERFNFNKDSFNALLPRNNVAKIFENPQHDEYLPRYVSLRLCAIREMFEECGVLLCTNHDHKKSSVWGSFFGGKELLEWQHRVHQNAEEFLNLCQQFDVYPDIWALKDWSNWLTPPSMKLKFNTIFFMVCLNQIPFINCDGKEASELMWSSPTECLDKNAQFLISLPPPQTYELSRLKFMRNIDKIAEFADERSKFGCETYWAYRIRTPDGLYSLLPGDDLYPENVDPDNSDVPFYLELPESKTWNRMLHRTEYYSKVLTKDFTPKCNHLLPN